MGGKEIHAGDWDLIIIDGDHRADAVFKDAMHSFDLIRNRGWLLFDDVRNRVPKPQEVPAGLTRFLNEKGKAVRLSWFHRFCDCYEVRK